MQIPMPYIFIHLLLAQANEAAPAAEGDLRARSVAVAEEVVRKLPGNARALRDLGKVHERFGAVEPAVKAYRDSLAAEPEQPGVLRDLGALLSPSAPEEAAPLLREALRRNRGLTGAHTHLGLLLAGQGRHRTAVDEFREEIRNRSADARTYQALGRSLEALGLHPQAENSFEEARRLKTGADSAPGSAQASSPSEDLRSAALTFLAAGETLQKGGMREDARTALGEALRHDPRLDDARRLLVESLREDRKVDEAIARCREGLAVTRNPELLYLLAGLLIEKETYPEAASLLEEVIRRDRSGGSAQRELARLILRKKVSGDPARALQLAEEAVKRNPHAQNFGILGWARHVNGDLPGARSALETAISLDSKNTGYRALLAELGEKRL